MADDFFDSLNSKDLEELRRILTELDPDDTNPTPDLVQRLADVLGEGLGKIMDDCDDCQCAGCRYRRHELPLISDEQHKEISMWFDRMFRSGFNDEAIGGLIMTIYALGVDNARAERQENDHGSNH